MDTFITENNNIANQYHNGLEDAWSNALNRATQNLDAIQVPQNNDFQATIDFIANQLNEDNPQLANTINVAAQNLGNVNENDELSADRRHYDELTVLISVRNNIIDNSVQFHSFQG